MKRQLSLAIVGADHPNKRGPTRRFEIAICKPGERVDLVPEPKNPVDPQAIAVFSERGVQIGYVRSERAQLVGSWLSNGHLAGAIFQEATEYGAAIRVGIDGEPPTLPDPLPPHREQDPDFWPDPVYDDE